jgi:protein-S-isoprenylcysteine O-methyltransferase Ste14
LVRDRSYLPIAFFAMVLAAMQDFTYPRGDHRLDLAWEGVCLLVGLLGVGIRAASEGFEARGGEALRTTGLYSIMRHPRNFGTLLLWLGIAMFPRMPWIPVLAIIAFWIYYEPRMTAEDQKLRRRFPRSYASWAAVTPMFLPRFGLWKRPHGSFAFVGALRREHTVLFVFVTALTVLEVAGDLNITSHFGLDREWGGLFGANAAMYATLSVLNLRRTPPPAS